MTKAIPNRRKYKHEYKAPTNAIAPIIVLDMHANTSTCVGLATRSVCNGRVNVNPMSRIEEDASVERLLPKACSKVTSTIVHATMKANITMRDWRIA